MSLLVKILVVWIFTDALFSFFDLIYRIDSEADFEMSWKERAIFDLIALLLSVFFLGWMKLEGWW